MQSAPHQCPECTKRFGKPTKLEAHLLEAHHAELRLSPGRLHLDDTVAQLLARAVAQANAAFADLDPHATSPAAVCPTCPPIPRRPFRNARALAQHLLSKHLQPPAPELDQNMSTVAPQTTKQECQNPVVAKVEDEQISSQISSNPRKREAPTSTTPDAKRPRVQPASRDIVAKGPVASSSNKPPVRPVVGGAGANMPVVAAVKSKSLPSTPPSGTKPPITPRKQPKPRPRSCSAAVPPPVPWIAASPVRIPVTAAVAAAPMDFSASGGFATNSRKPYYKLANR